MRSALSRFLVAGVATALLAIPHSLQAQGLHPNQGCTVFLVSDSNVSLGGNNEDWRDPLTKVWFVPPDEGHHGRVYFGFGNFFPQGGMNDQGLFFDGLAVTSTGPIPDDGKPVFEGNLADKAMAECATVDCVVEIFDHYRRPFPNAQLFFGNDAGSSVIIEPRGTVLKDGSYQVATNFFQTETAEEDRTCWRYARAREMLEGAGEVSVDLVRNVLDATHQEGNFPTQYSNVYDLKRRIVYLYYFHDFERVVEIDLAAELELGEHVYDLPDLFPPNQRAEEWAAPRRALAEGEQLAAQGRITDAVAKYAAAEESESSVAIPAQSWNVLCLAGGLWEHATEVMTACERAVELEPDNGVYRQSRGLARALTGDAEGAIQDLEAFLPGEVSEEDRSLRQGWIEALRRGENPFTPELLRSLRGG